MAIQYHYGQFPPAALQWERIIPLIGPASAAIREQAEENTNKANAILDLYEEMKGAIPKIVNSQYLIQTLDGIFRTPIFTGSGYTQATRIPSATVRRILPLLVQNNILKIIEPAKGRRSATYAFPALLNLAEGRTFF